MNSGLTAEILYIMANLEMANKNPFANVKSFLLFEYLLAMFISWLLEKLKLYLFAHPNPINAVIKVLKYLNQFFARLQF